MAGRGRAAIDVIEASLVDDVENAVRSAGSLPQSKLVSEKKLSAKATSELLDRLRARGLEVIPKGKSAVVRVPPPPPHEQLLEALAGGARLPLKRLKAPLPGLSKAAQDEAVARLAREGKARIVLRTRDEVLVGEREAVLTPDELAALERAAVGLADAMKRVQKKPGRTAVAPKAARTLLLDDVREGLAPLLIFLQKRPADPWQLVAAELRRLDEAPIHLISIARLVRDLAGRVGRADVHRMLAEAADRQWLELRPETGIELLSGADEALCPRGSGETVLSHVRLLHLPA
jgi:hypothetical protein